MALGNWHDELLNEFKNMPNGPITQMDLAEKVKCHFENEFSCFLNDSEDPSSSSYCGISFKKDDLLYHCSDCALDETCVLCEKCFNYDAHQNHNFWYTIGKDNSGSCDCGEADSWKSDLKCGFHSNTNISGAVQSSEQTDLITHFEAKLTPLLQFIIETLNNYRLSRNGTKDGDNCVLILYNDEKHSFNDVIEILTSEIGVSSDVALRIASNVNEYGIECIYYSTGSNCLRLSRKFRTLETSVETYETAFDMKLASEILKLISSTFGPQDNVQRFFKDWFLRDVAGTDSDFESMSNIGFLFRFDHLLWKCIRQIFGDYLNSCNAIDQEAKKTFASTYCRYYCDIFSAFLKEKREPHLSVTNFSVQIFTLVPVAEYCAENSGIIDAIIGKMTEILEPGFHHSSGLDFAKLRNFNYQKFTILTHDLLHLTRNIRACKLTSIQFMKIIDNFMYLLSLLTHMQGHFIKTGEHVLYERDNYDGANYITFELQQIGQEFARIFVGNYETSPLWALFEKYIDQKSSLSKLLNPPQDNIYVPLFKSKKRASFFGSLAWFYSSFLKAILSKYPDSSIPSKITKCFALDSLHRLLFSAEVRSGIWVRNGLVVRQQEYFYSSTVYHHLTYFPDIYNILAGSRLNDKLPFIDMITKQFCVLEYVQDQSQNGPLIDLFAILFLNCCSSAPLLLDHEQILINSLCNEAQTKSSLISILPDCVGDCPEFRDMVFKFAKLSHFNTIGVDSKLEIKTEYVERCDPIYWAYSPNFRLKTWSFFKQKNSMHIQSLYSLFVTKYKISLEVSREGDFLVELLMHFAEASFNECQFSLELVIILLKALFDMANDPSLAIKIASCIEKFSKRKNISEPAMQFLNEICATKNSTSTSPLESDLEKFGKSKKSSILSSFKRQRTAFMDEADAITDDDGICCVICSESKSDTETLCFPVQVNQSAVMTENGSKTLIIKGCYHLVHEACFESLPKVPNSLLKACTLCNSAIDSVYPYSMNQDDFYNRDLAPIKIVAEGFHSIEGDIDRIINFSDSIGMIDIHLKYLASTLCYLSGREMDLGSLPMHQILTLIQMKRFVVSKVKKLDRLDFNASFLIEESNSISPIAALEIIVPVFIFYLSGKVSADTVNNIFGRVLFLAGYGNYFNLALNLIRNEYLTSSSILDIHGFQLLDLSSILKMNTNLISLPSRYDEFLKSNLKRMCDQCGNRPISSAICLLCGFLVCVGRNCISVNGYRNGGCFTHRTNCSGDSIGTIIPAPYLSAYGEHDIDLSSMCSLNLNTQLYNGKLQEMWRNLEVRDFIIRNMDKSNIVPQSWMFL